MEFEWKPTPQNSMELRSQVLNPASSKIRNFSSSDYLQNLALPMMYKELG